MKNKSIKIKLERIEEEIDYQKSKFFGSPLFPTDFIEKNNLNDDFFICQINLSEIAYLNNILPRDGMLYFFLDISNYPYIAKVIYVSNSEELTTIYDDINDCFIDITGGIEALTCSFSLGDNDENYMFGCVNSNVIDNDYEILLCIDSLSAPVEFPNLGAIDGYYYFLIKEEDLRKKDFSKVIFISDGS